MWSFRYPRLGTDIAHNLVEENKQAVNNIIMVIWAVDKNTVINYVLWFRGNRHKVENFIEVNHNTICPLWSYYSVVILNCLDIYKPKFQLYTDLHTAIYYKWELVYCRTREDKGSIYITVKYTNCRLWGHDMERDPEGIIIEGKLERLLEEERESMRKWIFRVCNLYAYGKQENRMAAVKTVKWLSISRKACFPTSCSQMKILTIWLVPRIDLEGSEN